MLWRTYLDNCPNPANLDRDANLRQLFVNALGTEQGRAFAWVIVSLSEPGRQSHDDLATTAAFNEGAQSVGGTILALMDELSPGSIQKMEAEARIREEIVAAEISSNDDDPMGS